MGSDRGDVGGGDGDAEEAKVDEEAEEGEVDGIKELSRDSP